MNFLFALIMIFAVIMVFYLGYKIYKFSKPTTEEVEETYVDDNENVETKVFTVEQDNYPDEDTGKKALAAPWIATIVSIVVVIILLNLWDVRGVPADSLALIVVTCIFVYTWAYLNSVAPDGTKAWYIVFWLLIAFTIIVAILGWQSHRGDINVDNDTDETTVSTVTPTTPTTAIPTTEREPTGRMTTEGTTTREMTIREELFE